LFSEKGAPLETFRPRNFSKKNREEGGAGPVLPAAYH